VPERVLDWWQLMVTHDTTGISTEKWRLGEHRNEITFPWISNRKLLECKIQGAKFKHNQSEPLKLTNPYRLSFTVHSSSTVLTVLPNIRYSLVECWIDILNVRVRLSVIMLYLSDGRDVNAMTFFLSIAIVSYWVIFIERSNVASINFDLFY